MPKISLVINVPDGSSEKEFIKAIVQEARLQAREVWRCSHEYVRNKGGRPSLEKRVYEACEKTWKEWGGKFPRYNSTAGALVQKVAAILDAEARKGKGGTARPKRKDFRTIDKYVRRWIAGGDVEGAPDSWLRRPDGRKVVRTQAAMTAIALILQCKGNPSLVEEIKQALVYPTDKQLVDRLITNRKT